MTKEVRTRYAPSPTGYMHIGNLRSAIYEYLAAKIYGGKFILRIEDTDQRRYMEGAVDVIYETLAKVGIQHDEGPDIGGDYGPYVQSERLHIYEPYAKQLIESGHAYYCFCDKERLDTLRKDAEEKSIQYMYDRKCLQLSQTEIKEKLNSGASYVIRQKAPDSGETTYQDVVYGDITFDNETLEDQILIKSDGYPTYNFANVIDDHLMKITHVVRGSEYLSSTPKFVNLYEAFNWDIPIFVHLPLVVKADGTKISKRHGDAMFSDMIDLGYLPEAILNYTVLLGWSPGDEREFFTLEELETEFTLTGISKSPSTMDYAKLRWMNGEYLRKMTPDQFTDTVKPWVLKALPHLNDNKTINKIASMIQKRTDVLGEVPASLDFLAKINTIDPDLYYHKRMKSEKDSAAEILPVALEAIENLEDWNHDGIYGCLSETAKLLQVKNGKLMWPVRIALTGKAVTPGGAIEIADILGKEETIKRIKSAIRQLEE